MDPEFQTVLLRVLLVGGPIGVIGAAGLIIAFRAFGAKEKDAGSIRGFVIMVATIAFVLVACIVLLVLSIPTRT